ncbi:MAG: hypothetical protein LBQ79_07965 [Deltaproteobacteria bacterium]|jgi:hypothetical protein|nr:hypothetical protein [Deltaproteobacteria bacterium]
MTLGTTVFPSRERFLRMRFPLGDLHGASGTKAVIPADERDAIVTGPVGEDRLFGRKLLAAVHGAMRDYRELFKALAEDVVIASSAGISGFSGTGALSGPDILIGISLPSEFGAFTGFAHVELKRRSVPRLQ